MQEKFLLKTKRAVKKVAALSTGVAMLGATMTGALALNLAEDYPNSFAKDLAIVVGAEGSIGADSLAAIDLAFDIQYNAQECVEGTGATTVVSGGVEEDIPLGESLAPAKSAANSSVFDQELEDDDIDNFIDTSITFQSTDYDVHDVLLLGQDGNFVTLETSLTSADDDYETDMVFEAARRSIKYYYVFDETIQVNKTSTSDSLEIKFLGKTLKITSIDADNKFTARVGNEYFMNVGDSVEVSGKKVTLQNVGSGGAINIDVDGVVETISASGTETVNGIEINNDETFYEDNMAQRSATLVIGADAVETYKDGDAYVGEDKDDPNWAWDLVNLHTNLGTTISPNADVNTTGPKLGIENVFVWNDDSDNPAKVGECIDLPNNYVSICLDSLTVADDAYATYTFKRDGSTDLSEADGGSSTSTSVKAVYLHTGKTEGFLINTGALTINGSQSSTLKTSDIWLTPYKDEAYSQSVHLYYEDPSDSKVKLAGELQAEGSGVAGYVPPIQINYDNTKSEDVKILAWNTTGLSNINIKLVPYDSSLLPAYNDNITMNWTLDSNREVSALGPTLNTEEAAELIWEGLSTATNLGTKDEDQRTRYGIIIRDPKSHGSSDEVVLEIPRDQVMGNVIIKGTSTTTSGGGGETCTPVQVTPTNLLSNEVSDATAYNMVLVGGPVANPLVKTVMGIDTWQYAPGEALIKLAANGNKVAMLVAGTDAIDTRRAAKAVRTGAVTLSGTEVVLSTATETVTVKA